MAPEPKAVRTHLRVLIEGQSEPEAMALPAGVAALLQTILTHISHGTAVTLLPIEGEVTTQQAAALLNVSRPYVVQLLKAGKIPYRNVGVKRRLYLQDVLDYKRRIDEARLKTLAALADEA